VDDLWATKSEDVGLIVPAISFQDFNLCGHDPPTSQTDRQTDGQKDDMRCKTALCTIVHRAVKTERDGWGVHQSADNACSSWIQQLQLA